MSFVVSKRESIAAFWKVGIFGSRMKEQNNCNVSYCLRKGLSHKQIALQRIFSFPQQIFSVPINNTGIRSGTVSAVNIFAAQKRHLWKGGFEVGFFQHSPRKRRPKHRIRTARRRRKRVQKRNRSKRPTSRCLMKAG